MYLDAHTHLNEPFLFKNYKDYIKNFKKIWGEKIVNVWVDFERNERALKIQEEFFDICLSTWWFHPTEPIFKYKDKKYEFKKWEFVSWEKYIDLAKTYLEKLIEEKKIVAIGECGIDYYYFEFLKDGQTEDEVKKQQKELFIMQLDLAKKYNLPVVIHSRDAFYETLEITEKYKDLKIYFHCWGYGPNEVKKVKDVFPNLWIGFDGNITYKKAQELRDSIKNCDLNNILLETDAPYLTPQIVRKEKNQPANIKYIYDFVSDLLNLDLWKLKKQIKTNFNKFYFDK